MPVTIQIAQHDAQPCRERKTESVEELFHLSFPLRNNRSQGVIQSSLTRRDIRLGHILPSANGFVWAVLRAYNEHHHLILRPDDVWLAILSQVSFFMNAYPEELREGNIPHKGRKQLKIEDEASKNYSDFAIMSARMVRLVGENTLTPIFNSWMTPDFTTTDVSDIEAATILMLGTRRKYFKYKMHKKCGIPSVTLLGERKDWESILGRVRIIHQFGSSLNSRPEHQWEPGCFQKLLEPVIRGIIKSFVAPELASTRAFWNQIMSPCTESCGSENLFGWLSTFCFWDEDGRCLFGDERVSQKGCVLEGVQYHAINLDMIPSGVASLIVEVNDQDEPYRAELLAGFLGIKASSREAIASSALDTVQPLTGWVMSELQHAVDEEDEAPIPRPFFYYDDFDDEAPLPAAFIYKRCLSSDIDGEESNCRNDSDDIVSAGPMLAARTST